MVDFSEVFRVEKMRSGNPLVYLLKEQFGSFSASPQRVDMCDWIAKCFYQLEQYGDAGSWYEAAGRLILSEQSAPPTVKALTALDEYEKALECYGHGDDDGAFSECSTMIRRLKKACAPA